MICPKCQYQASDADSDRMPGVCPSCGIAYGKWLQAKAARRETQAPVAGREQRDRDTLWQRLYRYGCYFPEHRQRHVIRGQMMLYILFFVWGWSFILGGIDWASIGGSFLHTINLPFHEFGHVLFGFFGDRMMLLGGSLFQVMMPLAALGVFMVRQRDNFAASIMLWWAGQNCIDVSPYVADAPTRFLPLVGDRGPGSHDWWNLLIMSGNLDRAGLYAGAWFACGAGLIILANVWGGWLLWLATRRVA